MFYVSSKNFQLISHTVNKLHLFLAVALYPLADLQAYPFNAVLTETTAPKTCWNNQGYGLIAERTRYAYFNIFETVLRKFNVLNYQHLYFRI